MTPDQPHGRRGRPRDVSIDIRVLDAARQLLVEQGFEATTVQAIAERSAVHASAIYRRWPSRVEIIEQAVFPGLSPVTVRPTGDLRRDLRRFVRAYASTMAGPAARAAVPGLLAVYQVAGRANAAETWFAVSARPQFLDVLRAAPPGSVDPAADPDDVFDTLLGCVLARTLIPTVAQRDRPLERLVDICLRLLQPMTTQPAAARPATVVARP
ncbi:MULTISPECIES: TetR/AcrR family transcriptional regulator [unclassified Pseudofrankia]|uniref:TetR/AcrR family transcriptional regulator n=1 Tax=unclassified Pseudofrankia TaxID=2994372 RepID=UPI0008D98160|nr:MULTISPECIES: TetR/AcrR family transcriptional regulator [unclassified Pseudofrankia]MDT3446141.1 TetR/AcrR family transcriptional regulator [Pseudofrankia sp. BMG5.37]OHV62269.1 TetR family transcriptional regulator [Pseudofrankia sp. BMG5.36]